MTEDDLFLGTSGPHNADVIIVGEAWGRTEAVERAPFVGASGKELTRILAEGGFDRRACLLTNVVPAQPRSNDMTTWLMKTSDAKRQGMMPQKGIYPRGDTIPHGVERLQHLIKTVNPRVVIALGNWPLWALTADDYRISDSKGFKVPTGIGSWRGSQLRTTTGHKLVPTYHPAAILRQWSWRQVAVHDLRARAKKALLSGDSAWNPPDYRFAVRPTFDAVMARISAISAAVRGRTTPSPLSVDLETRAGHIACIGLAWTHRDALCIPIMCVENDAGYWSPAEEAAIYLALRKLLTDPRILIVGQNFLYDAQYLARYLFFKPTIGFDTLVAQHLCWPGLPKGLDYLSSMYCEYHCYWKDEGKLWDPRYVDEDDLWTYNCKDAVATYECYEILSGLIEQFGLSEQWQWELDQLPLMLDMMLTGVRIDRDARINMVFELDEAIASRTQRLDHIIPWSRELVKSKTAKPWYFSPKQQQKIFYEELGIKPIFNRKTKRVTIDDEALERIGRREPILKPVTQMLQELRSARVFKNTFLEARLGDDNRMRCSYNVHPETFRWSSSEDAFGNGCNLQTIPSGTEDYKL